MTTELEWEDVELPDVPRDRWQRPLIIPPGGGREIPYRRPSQEGKVLEDLFSLSKWEQRMTAVGLSRRPDLLLRASSLGAEPAKIVEDPAGDWVPNPRYRPWVNAMDDTCSQAKEAAQAHARATIGTSLHALCERADRGEDVGIVPEQYLPHLLSYARETDGWEWLAIERFMVCDPMKLAGRPDRVARIPGHPRPMIADIKTGDVTYGAQSRCVQLATYAHSVFYDLDGTRHDPPEEIDTETALIIHLDAITGRCKVYRLDISPGWRALQLAQQVRAWRAHKGLEEPWAPAPAPRPSERPTRRLWAGLDRLDVSADVALVQAITKAASVAELTTIWQSVRPSAWTKDHTARAAARKAELLEGVDA